MSEIESGQLVRVKRLDDSWRDFLYAGWIGRVGKVRDGRAWVDTDGYKKVQAVTFRDWFGLDELEDAKEAQVDVIWFKAEDGSEFYAEASEGGQARRRQVEAQVGRAREIGNPVVEVKLMEMDAEEYGRIPASNASAEFFGDGRGETTGGER